MTTHLECIVRTMISNLKGSDSTQTAESDEALQEPSPKHPCTEMWKMYNEILEETGTNLSDEDNTDELHMYIAEPLVPFGRKSGFHWWGDNSKRFPNLAKIAQKYLCAPPTSVPSERLFSGAGNIYDEKRNRLTPENAEILLFIKNNMKL